jgi:hypothetical protein
MRTSRVCIELEVPLCQDARQSVAALGPWLSSTTPPKSSNLAGVTSMDVVSWDIPKQLALPPLHQPHNAHYGSALHPPVGSTYAEPL